MDSSKGLRALKAAATPKGLGRWLPQFRDVGVTELAGLSMLFDSELQGVGMTLMECRKLPACAEQLGPGLLPGPQVPPSPTVVTSLLTGLLSEGCGT